MMAVLLGTHGGQFRDCWMGHVDGTGLEKQMHQGLVLGWKDKVVCDDRAGCYLRLLGDSPTLCF